MKNLCRHFRATVNTRPSQDAAKKPPRRAEDNAIRFKMAGPPRTATRRHQSFLTFRSNTADFPNHLKIMIWTIGNSSARTDWRKLLFFSGMLLRLHQPAHEHAAKKRPSIQNRSRPIVATATCRVVFPIGPLLGHAAVGSQP